MITETMFRGKAESEDEGVLLVKSKRFVYRISLLSGTTIANFRDYNNKKIKVTIETEEV